MLYIKKDNSFFLMQRQSTQPTHKELYNIEGYNKEKILIDNLILNDCILGAAYICEKEILKKYLKKIIGKIKLCEDFSYRIMLLDDINIYLYNQPVIYYCYGTGISSKKKKDGKSILSDDEIAFRNIISKMEYKTKIKKKIANFLNNNFNNRYINRIISFLYFPKAINLLLKTKIMKKNGKSKTITTYDKEFLNSINIVNIEK